MKVIRDISLLSVRVIKTELFTLYKILMKQNLTA